MIFVSRFSDEQSGRTKLNTPGQFETSGESTIREVSITRAQIKALDDQQKMKGEFRPIDRALGKLEQVLVDQDGLRDNTRASLSKLFGDKILLMKPAPLKAWPGPWLRDMFLQAEHVASAKRSFIIPYGAHQIYREVEAAKYLANVGLNRNPIKCRFIDNFIEGGDLCVVGKYVFVGANTILREASNIGSFYKKRVTYDDAKVIVMSALERLYGRQVIVLDDAEIPPLFHLDLYFLPLVDPSGKPTIVLGDILLFIQDVLGMTSAQLYEEQQYYDWFYDQEIGDGKADYGPFNYEGFINAVRSGPVKNQYQDIVASTEMLVEQISSMGFAIERVPLPYIAHVPVCHGLHTRGRLSRQKYTTCCQDRSLAFSTLNGVLEAYPYRGKLKQTLRTATYGFRRADKAMTNVLNKRGCKVKMEPNFLKKAFLGGGVHCLTSEWRKGFVESSGWLDRLGQCL